MLSRSENSPTDAGPLADMKLDKEYAGNTSTATIPSHRASRLPESHQECLQSSVVQVIGCDDAALYSWFSTPGHATFHGGEKSTAVPSCEHRHSLSYCLLHPQTAALMECTPHIVFGIAAPPP